MSTPPKAEAWPHHILFLCNMNAIRSPMAEAIARNLLGDGAQAESLEGGGSRKDLGQEDQPPSALTAQAQIQVTSAGLYAGEIDFFVEETLAEIGLSLQDHSPRALSSLDITAIDKIIALTEEARQAALALGAGDKIEYWPISNPTDIRENSRTQILAAYRRARNEIYTHIQRRFCRK